MKSLMQEMVKRNNKRNIAIIASSKEVTFLLSEDKSKIKSILLKTVF